MYQNHTTITTDSLYQTTYNFAESCIILQPYEITKRSIQFNL